MNDLNRVPPRYRVAEIFGPTIQGEGRFIGAPCYFLRLGGCDYRCTWCDSMHAVLPEKVKQLPFLSPMEIVDQLCLLKGDFGWLIISGGNPALYDLAPILDELDHRRPGIKVAVETQGSVWGESLPNVNYLTISPKPPSSGMRTSEKVARMFQGHVETFHIQHDYKFVVFDEIDYFYALQMADALALTGFFLSVGTNPGDTRDQILDRWEGLVQKVLNDKNTWDLDIRILPQSHVLLWGHKLGV